MPRTLKLPHSPSAEQTKARRLTLSRSAGDLLTLSSAAPTETPNKQRDHRHHLHQSKSTFFIHPNGKEKKIKSGAGDELKENKHPFCWGVLPNPQDSIVCGELYRLSSFGIWCRLWMELRLSYMFFYYNRDDSIPVDVIHLKNYRLVPKAPECDHLEGLFPFKIVSEEEQKIIFLYAESKECCVMWIAALYRACAQKPSRVIEGLNLARKNPLVNGTKANNVPVTNENVKNSWLSFVKQLKTDDDSELINSFSPLDHSNQTLEALHRCESTIRNTYDRALELTEHEALRRNIYFFQRRLSTQIKVKTLENQMQNKNGGENVRLELNALQEHLESINSKFEETNRAAEQTFQELETKKAEKLKRLQSAYPSSCPSPRTPSDDDPQHRITYIVNEPTNAELVIKRRKKRVGPGAFRPRTFSPGDWSRNSRYSENPLTAQVVEGLRKSESVNDLGVDHERHSKLRSPFQRLSRAVKELKRTKSVETLSPISSTSPSPPMSPKSPTTKRDTIGRRLLRSISHQETRSHPPEFPKSSVFYGEELPSPTSPQTKAKPVFSIGPAENLETFDFNPVVTKTDPEGEEELIYHFQQNNSDKSRDQTQTHHHHGTKVGKKILRILSLKGRKKDHDLSVP